MKNYLIPLCSMAFLFLSCEKAPEPLEAQVTEPPPRVLVHPEFDLSSEELQELLAGEMAETIDAVKQKPQVFLELVSQALELPDHALVLVDKQHALAAEYAPEVVVELDDYPLLSSRAEKQLSGWALPALLELSETAALQGITLPVSSTYRSYKYQEWTYNWCVDQYGQEEADRVSAYPGKSQHQLGNAVDFGSISEEFEFTDAGQWLLKNASDFGWSMSYPKGMEEVTGYKYEVWHYRYITPVGTALQRDYFMDIQQYFLSFWNDHKQDFQRARFSD